MSAKVIKLKKEKIDLIKKTLPIAVTTGNETNVDFQVRTTLIEEFGEAFILQNKTECGDIDIHIPSKSAKGTGNGKLDVLCFNLYGTKNIDFIVENKHPTDKSFNPSDEAKYYANGINKNNKVGARTRLIIGYNPADKNDIKVCVLVNDEWKDLIIDGLKVSSFFSKQLVDLVYENPDVNEFSLKEEIEFSQRDFHKIIDELKTSYRSITELHTSDKTKIDFTIAFVSLKMILEKESVVSTDGIRYQWNQLQNMTSITNAVETIANNFPKYKDIFVLVIKKKSKKEESVFDFGEKIKSMSPDVVMSVYGIINKIPAMHSLKLDLFGETYEVLASKKTKSELGEYFTRRHIIRPLIRLLFTPNDLDNIINNDYKLCDTSCGTGGFLTESFKYIEEYYNTYHSNLNMDLSALASRTICGYDINGSNITRTKINMYLAGDGFSEIETKDTLKIQTTKKVPCEKCKNCVANKKDSCSKPIYVQGDISSQFNFIVTNIPYGKGETIVDPSISNSKRLEVNFLIQIVKLLKHNGKALIVVPDGLIEASTLASVREWVLKHCKISAIVSLPKFAFAPYTKEKTYVLYLEKRLKPLNAIDDVIALDERFWAYIVDNDGFANSDKRFETNLTDASGRWKHNEVSTWVSTVTNQTSVSLLEEKFGKNQLPDETYFDEWGSLISGKKYGYISMNDVFSHRIVSYAEISKSVELQNIIDAKYHLLNDVDIAFLDSKKTSGKGGRKSMIQMDEVIKDLFDEDGIQKDSDCDALRIFELLNLEYDSEDETLYDKSTQSVKYALNLIPEKYFRQRETTNISISELTDIRKNIEIEVNNLAAALTSYKGVVSNKIMGSFRRCFESILVVEGEKKFVKDICTIKRGHVISEQDIYSNFQKDGIPVYSSKTLNDGVMGTVSREFFNLSKMKGEPNTLTWNTDGHAGRVFKRTCDYLFTNVCGQLTIKNREEVDIDFLKIILNQLTTFHTTSNANNGKLMSEQMANIQVTIPPMAVQQKIVAEYFKIEQMELGIRSLFTII